VYSRPYRKEKTARPETLLLYFFAARKKGEKKKGKPPPMPTEGKKGRCWRLPNKPIFSDLAEEKGKKEKKEKKILTTFSDCSGGKRILLAQIYSKRRGKKKRGKGNPDGDFKKKRWTERSLIDDYSISYRMKR